MRSARRRAFLLAILAVSLAAGSGTALATKGKPAEIPSETRINFRLDQPLTITEKINN